MDEAGIWQDDLLGRQADAEFLIRFLLGSVDERSKRGLPRSYVLNVDASWGHGKTFFVTRLAKTLEAKGYLVASVNAWVDDHADDPLLSVISAIDLVVSPLIGSRPAVKKTWNSIKRTGAAVAIAAAKGAATNVARKVIGDGVDAVLQELGQENGKAVKDATTKAVDKIIDEKAEMLLGRFKEGKESIETFRRELEKFLAEAPTKDKKSPLFVLVDELDRCRPSYAIELLERVKHLFSIDNVIFVFATDAGQLQHAIGAVYGGDFDGQRYLRRFFDRTYIFEEPSLEEFVSSLLSQGSIPQEKISVPPNITLEKFISEAFLHFGLSLRDAEQCIDILHDVVAVWDYDIPIEIAALLPLAIARQQGVFPNFDSEIIDKLKQLVARNNGRPNAWVMSFRVYRSGHTQYERVAGLELFELLIDRSAKSLPEMSRAESPGEKVQWLEHQFEVEFMRLHRNQYPPGRPPYSIILQYSAIVRSAGRLLPNIKK